MKRHRFWRDRVIQSGRPCQKDGLWSTLSAKRVRFCEYLSYAFFGMVLCLTSTSLYAESGRGGKILSVQQNGPVSYQTGPAIRGTLHESFRSSQNADASVELKTLAEEDVSDHTSSVTETDIFDQIENPDGISENLNSPELLYDDVNGAPASKASKASQAALDDENEFLPQGIRLGQFLLYPWLKSDVILTDNVLLSETDQKWDRILEIAPGLKMVSEWRRHSLEAEMSGKRNFHDVYSSEDDAAFQGEVRGRIDFHKRTQLLMKGSYAYSEETRDSLDAVSGTAERTGVETTLAETEIRHQFNRLKISLRGTITQSDYADALLLAGGSVNNDDRDATEFACVLRTSYDVSERLTAISEVQARQKDYSQALDDNGVNRDSTGHALRGGFGLEFSPKLRGEILAGYMTQDPDEQQLSDLESMIIDASLEWNISALTRLKFLLQSGLQDTTLANTAGSLSHAATVELSHKVKRNVSLVAGLSYETEDFSGVNIEEEQLKASLGAEYLLNRNISAQARYEYIDFTSSVDARDYVENRVNFGVHVKR